MSAPPPSNAEKASAAIRVATRAQGAGSVYAAFALGLAIARPSQALAIIGLADVLAPIVGADGSIMPTRATTRTAEKRDSRPAGAFHAVECQLTEESK